MNYRFLCALLCILFLASLAFAENNTSTTSVGNNSEYDLERNILSIPSISVVIDSSGMVSVTEEIIASSGDIAAILVPKNVQDVSVLDSREHNLSFEMNPQIDKQLVAFLVGQSNKSEEEVSLKYTTQGLTSKSGDVWSLNFSTTATPQTKTYPGTIIKLYTPKKTQITKINFSEDIIFSPIGDSEIWFYPQKKEFDLSFDYTMGSTEGPIITRPGETTTTLNTSATTPVGVVDFKAYFLPWAVLLLLMLFFLLYRLRTRTNKGRAKAREVPAKDSALGSVSAEDPVSDSSGNGLVYNVNHDVALESKASDYVKADVKEKQVKDVSMGGAVVKSKSVKESILNVLDESERIVVGMLEKAEDEITQAYVYKSTGMPKSSLSDTIKRLEKRNIIEIKKEGRTNWIKLKSWVFE